MRDRLRYTVDLDIPHYRRVAAERHVRQRSIRECQASRWYAEFRERVFARWPSASAGVRFSDGECFFCVGHRIGRCPPGVSAVRYYCRTFLSTYVNTNDVDVSLGHPTSSYETYSGTSGGMLASSSRDVFATSQRTALLLSILQ